MRPDTCARDVYFCWLRIDFLVSCLSKHGSKHRGQAPLHKYVLCWQSCRVCVCVYIEWAARLHVRVCLMRACVRACASYWFLCNFLDLFICYRRNCKQMWFTMRFCTLTYIFIAIRWKLSIFAPVYIFKPICHFRMHSSCVLPAQYKLRWELFCKKQPRMIIAA